MTRPARYSRSIKSAALFVMLAATVLSAAGLRPPAALAQRPDIPGPGSPNGLVINEVFTSQNNASEYFELYNTGGAAINLSTYVIYNRDANPPTSLSQLSDPNIAPGQVKVIGPAQLGQPTIAGSGLAQTDFLALVNTSPADQVIDVVNWGGPPDLSWPNYDDFSQYFFANGTQPSMTEDSPRSIQRWPDGVDTDTGSDFRQIYRSPGTFSCGDPFEDDNTFSTAFGQAINTTEKHRICPAGDTDYIAISVSANFTYTLQATAIGSRVSTQMRLYDPSGALIVETTPNPNRNSTINFRPASAGTYRVQVLDSTNSGGIGPDWIYSFTITQQAAATATPGLSATPTPIGCVDAYEPDDTLQQARGIEQNTEQAHTFCKGDGSTPDQNDWLVFSASSGKIYTLYTKDLAGPVDTIISLYDQSGNKLAENDDYQPGTSLASRIDYAFSNTGVYYLRVHDKRGASGRGYQYTVGLSTTGALPPTATATASPTLSPFSPTPTTGACYDQYEPDGVPETAKVILIGQNQTRHSICPAADADWARFYARAGKVYTIRTANLGIGLDTYMYLFDSDAQTVVAQNDDGGDGVSSRIDFYPLRDDWYYVQVKNAGDLGIPEMVYDLSLAVVPGVPQPPGTATPIIAPVVTVTSGPGGGPATPTTLVQPTKPPVVTPTQGVIPPTPEKQDATPVPPPPPTSVPPTAAAEPTQVPPEVPTEVVPGVPGTGGEQGPVPGVPRTGAQPAEVIAAPRPPAQPNPAVELAPMLFRVFYDRDRSDSFGRGEGIKGVSVYFLDAQNSLSPTGSLMTGEAGSASLRLPTGPQRVYIPYFGINMALTKFPERELHSLWLPPVDLPSRVP